MTLPIALQKAIEKELEGSSLSEITKAREELSSKYRDKIIQNAISDDSHRLSYLATRLPATFQAVKNILEKISLIDTQRIQSLVDLGAGPGTAMWAASEILFGLNKFTCIENDSGLVALGQKLSKESNLSSIKNANWVRADFTTLEEIPKGDLIILSYSIGEINEKKRSLLLEKCWESTEKILVIIEPGTPPGFERIRKIRHELIDMGGMMIAPCPHHDACPMSNGDWCHFSARVERTSIHRQAKGGTLGHEDEKFSYVAFAKSRNTLPWARILRHPQKRKGHIGFTLCSKDGLIQKIISKKTPDTYKDAKKWEWGDSIQDPL